MTGQPQSGSRDSGCRPWPPDHPSPLDLAEAAIFTGPLALLAAFWQTARLLARAEGAARQAWEALG